MPSTGEQLVEIVAAAEELAGNYDLAEAIRGGALDGDGPGNDAPTAVADSQTVTTGGELNVPAASGVLSNDRPSRAQRAATIFG